MIFLLQRMVFSLFILIPISIKSMQMVLPQVRSVCPGEKIVLTCLTNESLILKWAITVPKANMTYSKNVPITGSGLLPVIKHQTVHNTAVFNFSRPSESGSFPFTTILIIDGISNDLNGTEIICSEVMASLPIILDRTIIVVKEANLTSLKVSVREEFETANVTVILHILQEEAAAYSVHVDPLTNLLPSSNNNYQFIVPYNNYFNVSVEAAVCGQVSTSYAFTLNYGKCSYPPVDYMDVIMDNIPANDMGPKVPGTNITFSCPSGLELNGTDITCNKNGEWDPDPRDVTCTKGNSSPVFCTLPLPPSSGYIQVQNADLAMEGSNNITFVCHNGTSDEATYSSLCTSSGKWQPNPREFCSNYTGRIYERLTVRFPVVVGTSISTAVLIIILFILGSLCSWFCYSKHKQKSNSSIDHSLPIYEDIGEAIKHKQCDLELSANVSYGPIRS